MSESHKDSMSDDFNDWNDGLTDEEYAELRRITTKQERKTILVCAQEEDNIKCNNKIKSILRTMKERGVDLNLIWKYTWQHLDERLHHEKVADFINEVQKESAGGMKRKRSKKIRRTHKKTRRSHKKTRRSY